MKHCAQFGCPECIHMENKLELLRLLKEYHEDPEWPGWFWTSKLEPRKLLEERKP